MNWCTFGIHDYVIQSASGKVNAHFNKLLLDRGFTLTRYPTKILGDEWSREDGVTFRDNPFMSDYIRPTLPEDSACMRCGKIKHSYKMDDIEGRLEYEIQDQLKDLVREHKAKDIISKGEYKHDAH